MLDVFLSSTRKSVTMFITFFTVVIDLLSIQSSIDLQLLLMKCFTFKANDIFVCSSSKLEYAQKYNTELPIIIEH